MEQSQQGVEISVVGESDHVILHDNEDQEVGGQTWYESWLSGWGLITGSLRKFLPCFCCCCPYPFTIIDEGTVGLLQQYGKYAGTLKAGMHQVNPCSETVTVVDMRTQEAQLNQMIVISRDNIPSILDAVIYYRCVDPVKSTYRVQLLRESVIEIAHSVIRTITAEHTLQEQLNNKVEIQERISNYVESLVITWGIYVEKIFIKDQRLEYDISSSLALAGVTVKEAEASIINARAQVICASFQRESAQLLNSNAAMQIRQLETIKLISQAPGEKILMINL